MIQSALYYWVECDNCGRDPLEYSEECSVFADSAAVLEALLDSEGTTDGVRHHCMRCRPLHKCEGCDAPVDDPDAGERDYLCQECWDREQALTPAQTGDTS